MPNICPVDRDEIIKCYEISKGQYVPLEDEEIEAVRIESRKMLGLVQLVDTCEIDPLYFEKPYYVALKDDLAEEAFIVLREPLCKAKKVALGQLSARGSEKLVALNPCGKGLHLRYADEVRQGQAFFSDIDYARPKKEPLDLAITLIEPKSAPFGVSEYEDRYIEALRKLIDKEVKSKSGKAIEDVDEPDSSGGNVIDLMEALRKSVVDKKPPAKSKKSA